jgi:hypothetical protein
MVKGLYHRMLFQTHLSDSSLLMRVSSSAEWLMIFTATRRLFHTPGADTQTQTSKRVSMKA